MLQLCQQDERGNSSPDLFFRTSSRLNEAYTEYGNLLSVSVKMFVSSNSPLDSHKILLNQIY